MKNVAFKVILDAKNCTPNGDPMTSQPRVNIDGLGVMSEECIKRKIRMPCSSWAQQSLFRPKNLQTIIAHPLKAA